MKLEPYTEELRGCPVKGNAYPVLVLGIGNPLMGDDGAGVELATASRNGTTARWSTWRKGERRA